MKVDPDLIYEFEKGLNPQDIGSSSIPAVLLGYGEISAIFRIGDDNETAYKRMPLFKDRKTAEDYEVMYHEYCGLVKAAGILLPETETVIAEVPGRPIVLYIAQTLFPLEQFAHKLIHTLSTEESRNLIGRIMAEIKKIRIFNHDQAHGLEIALDAQLSNWVASPEGPIYFVDTSTPFIRENGVHRLDPDLILQAAPGLVRGIFKLLFVDEVMNRYYEIEKNLTDLAANLFKEQKPELVPVFLEEINKALPEGTTPLTLKSVEKYYRGDKLIWTLFLGIRRLDRWVKTGLLGRRYEFILPGRIKR